MSRSGPPAPRDEPGRAQHEDPGSPWGSPVLRVALASTLLGVMGVSLISPSLPILRRALAITEFEASLVLVAFTLPGILLSPVLGLLADRYGYRRVLVPCLVVDGLAGGAVFLAPGLGWVLALRFLQGTAAAGLLTIAVALIGDAFSGPQRTAVLGINGTVMAAGLAAYPLLGGLLASLDWRAPFLVYLSSLPVAFYALKALEGPGHGRAPTTRAYLRGVLAALPKRPALVLYGTITLVFTLLYGGLLTAVPFLLDAEHGADASTISLLVGLMAITTALASASGSKLARRWSAGSLAAGGMVSLGAGLGMIGLLEPIAALAAGVLVFGLGVGLSIPSLDTAVSRLLPQRYRGGAMSVRTSMVRLGQTIGPALFTALAVTVGYRIQLLVSGILAMAVGVLALGLLVATGRAGSGRSTGTQQGPGA